MVSNALDFGEIAKNCGLDIEPASIVIKNIEDKIHVFTNDNSVDFILYLLDNVNDEEILYGVIKLSEVYRDDRLLSKLLDILLLRNIDIEQPELLINVRVIAAKIVAKYKDTSTLGALLYCLNNKNENYKIRLACADSLGRIGDKYAVEPLIDIVKDDTEKSIYVKETATFALGILGDTSAIEPLVSIMEASQGLLGKFSFLKEKIVEALGRLNLNNQKVLKVLKGSLFDTSPMVRINTIEALMNSEFDEAEDLIREALNDEDDEVKRNALIALYNMIGVDFLDEIISLPGYNKFLKSEAKILKEEYED